MTSQDVKVFVVFHSKLYDELYEELDISDKKKVVMYGVNPKYNKNYNPIHTPMFEYDLPHYTSVFQDSGFDESSSLYHVYHNQLYNDCEYIGFAQYDMKFYKDTFSRIQNVRDSDPSSQHIFYLFGFDLKRQSIVGALRMFNCEKNNAITDYNQYFGTNFSLQDLKQSKVVIMNNTFVIPKQMYTKMMPWLLRYLKADLDLSHIESPRYGNVVEALTGMFLAFEVLQGAKLHNFHITHVWPHYKLQSYNDTRE